MALTQVEMVQAVGTEFEATLAAGRLGMYEGEKVLKLTEPPDPQIQAALERMVRPPPGRGRDG